MFRSQVTKQLSQPKEKQFRTITERRERTYINQYYNDNGKQLAKLSKGWEIVSEIKHREGEF